MSWGIFPLFFAANGLGVERIGILKAVYPAVWGLLQVATGPLSDRWGRKGLIVGGMWIQAGGALPDGLYARIRLVAGSEPAARSRHGDGLSEPDRCSVRCLAPVMARAFAQRLPFLARPGLRDRGALGRHHRRPVRPRLGDRLDCSADIRVGCGRRIHNAIDGRNAGSGDRVRGGRSSTHAAFSGRKP